MSQAYLGALLSSAQVPGAPHGHGGNTAGMGETQGDVPGSGSQRATRASLTSTLPGAWQAATPREAFQLTRTPEFRAVQRPVSPSARSHSLQGGRQTCRARGTGYPEVEVGLCGGQGGRRFSADGVGSPVYLHSVCLIGGVCVVMLMGPQDWELVKESVMRTALLAKFSQVYGCPRGMDRTYHHM